MSNTCPSTSRLVKSLRLAALATSIGGSILLAVPVTAQTTLPANPAEAVNAANPARVQRSMLVNLAENNRAEIQAAKLALEKSQNSEVKKYAQTMVDEHGKALSEVETLAQSKGFKLPDGVGAVHKTKELALKALSGSTFDSQYIKRVGVGDHESTVKLLKKMQVDAQDPDLKGLADMLLPRMQHHLETARELAQAN